MFQFYDVENREITGTLVPSSEANLLVPNKNLSEHDNHDPTIFLPIDSSL